MLTQWAIQGLGTTLTLVSICQNDQFQFSFLQNTYLNLVQVVTCAASIVASWYIQRHWKVDIKKLVRSAPSSNAHLYNGELLVHDGVHLGDTDTGLGNDWHLDKQIRVGFQIIPSCYCTVE